MIQNNLMKLNNILIISLILIFFFFTELYWTTPYVKFSWYNAIKGGMGKGSHLLGIVPLNKKICYENLALLHQIFKKHNIFFWLSEGTALGFRRGNDFIDYDDDLDIGIYAKDEKKMHSAMNELNHHGFMCAGFKISSRFPYALTRKGEKICIDITGKGLHCAAIGDSCESLIPYVQTFNKITIKSKIYNIPKDDYYKKLYGNDWMIPIKNKKYNTN